MHASQLFIGSFVSGHLGVTVCLENYHISLQVNVCCHFLQKHIAQWACQSHNEWWLASKCPYLEHQVLETQAFSEWVVTLGSWLYMCCMSHIFWFSVFPSNWSSHLGAGVWMWNVPPIGSHVFIRYHQLVALLWSLQEAELCRRKWTTVGRLWDFKPNLTSCSLPVSWLAVKMSLFTLATMASWLFWFKLLLFRHFETWREK